MKSKALEKTKTQMRRGVLELCTLSIIAEEEAYTSDIRHKLKDADLIVVEGTLYPLLSRLKESKLVKYNWKESPSGPPRKYYQITEEGQAFLSQLKETWDNLVTAVNKSTKNLIK